MFRGSGPGLLELSILKGSWIVLCAFLVTRLPDILGFHKRYLSWRQRGSKLLSLRAIWAIRGDIGCLLSSPGCLCFPSARTSKGLPMYQCFWSPFLPTRRMGEAPGVSETDSFSPAQSASSHCLAPQLDYVHMQRYQAAMYPVGSDTILYLCIAAYGRRSACTDHGAVGGIRIRKNVATGRNREGCWPLRACC